MSLPADLQQRINGVLDALHTDPLSDLDVDVRLSVYQFFDTLPSIKARIARTYMALMVAQRVLDRYVLPSEHGYSTMTQLMVTTAGWLLALMQEGYDSEHLEETAHNTTVDIILGTESDPIETYKHSVVELAELAAEMDSLTGEAPNSLNYLAWCVFLTAMSTLREALGWPWWKEDAAQWAARADAGGIWTAHTEQNPDDVIPQGEWDFSTLDARAKRRTFWVWWCTEVVPNAWHTIKSNRV